MNADYWLPVWREKALRAETTSQMSGRSNYTERHRELLVRDAVRALELSNKDSLLDVGCAAGFTGEPLSRIVREYIGLDYCEESLLLFAKRTRQLIGSLHCGSAVSLPFGDASFEKSHVGSVLLCLSLEECEQSLRELYRVTRSRAFVSGNLEGKKPKSPGCPEGCRCYAHQTWFLREELESLALRCGWGTAEALDMHPDLPHSYTMFDLLVTK